MKRRFILNISFLFYYAYIHCIKKDVRNNNILIKNNDNFIPIMLAVLQSMKHQVLSC